MTKQENIKCEKLLNEAIRTAKQAIEEFSSYNEYEKAGETIKAEIEQRKADNHMGYAEGINQVLNVLGFKHDKINELQKLI